MKIPVNLAGGGSSGSDDVTATAAQVLSPYTAITNESEDEPQMGTMADYAGTTQAATGSLDTSNSRYQLTIPNDGRYTTGSKIYQTYANARSTIGYTDASKVLSGTTFLGLAGTMADYSGTSTAATSSTSGSNVRLKIPNNGYYNTSAYLTNSYSNMASTIGLTAAKIKYGETILGITGTWNGYVATSTDLYYGGATGSLGGSFTAVTSASSASVTTDTACIVFSRTSGSTGGWGNNGIYFANSINMAGYSKLTLTWSMVSAPSSGSGTWPCIYIGVYSSKPTSSTLNPSAYALLYASRYLVGTSAGTTYTLSVDLSSVSQSLYVGAGFGTYSSTNGNFTANVTRIQLS